MLCLLVGNLSHSVKPAAKQLSSQDAKRRCKSRVRCRCYEMYMKRVKKCGDDGSEYSYERQALGPKLSAQADAKFRGC